jgi:hypothetical protein
MTAVVTAIAATVELQRIVDAEQRPTARTQDRDAQQRSHDRFDCRPGDRIFLLTRE